jgi:hypothetical protein
VLEYSVPSRTVRRMSIYGAGMLGTSDRALTPPLAKGGGLHAVIGLCASEHLWEMPRDLRGRGGGGNT